MGEIDSADDISNTDAACNECGMLINHPVPYLAGFFVTLVARKVVYGLSVINVLDV